LVWVEPRAVAQVQFNELVLGRLRDPVLRGCTYGLRIMPDRQLWTFINSFAPWASALASSSAVVTALYLARRGDRIRLRVRCGIRVVIHQEAPPGPRAEYVNLEVTNVGRRTATIQTLFWTAGFFRKKQMVWIPPKNVYSKPVPVTLAD